VLEAAMVYLLPGGVAGMALAAYAGRAVRLLGALPTLIGGSLAGVAGFVLLAFLRGQPWVVVVAGVLTQVAVTVAYAALPALVVQAVDEEETGVANAVNTIARTVGQALGSTVAVTLIAANLDPSTGFPRAVAFTEVALMGAAASLAVVAVGGIGLLVHRRSGTGRGPDPLAPVEEAIARAGEWSPVSGIR
jgi:predicted MFS family arabinose efflux permease